MLLDVTRATGLGLCVSQAVVSLAVIASFEEPHARVFTADMRNGTQVSTMVSSYGMSPFLLAVSLACAMFAMKTKHLEEVHVVDSLVEFGADVEEDTVVWDAILFSLFAAARSFLVLYTCSPVDAYALVLIVSAHTYSVRAICSPRAGRLYLPLGVLFVAWMALYANVRATDGPRMGVFFMHAMADAALITGHTHDREVNTATVANCRLSYCCLQAASCLVVYML